MPCLNCKSNQWSKVQQKEFMSFIKVGKLSNQKKQILRWVWRRILSQPSTPTWASLPKAAAVNYGVVGLWVRSWCWYRFSRITGRSGNYDAPFLLGEVLDFCFHPGKTICLIFWLLFCLGWKEAEELFFAHCLALVGLNPFISSLWSFFCERQPQGLVCTVQSLHSFFFKNFSGPIIFLRNIWVFFWLYTTFRGKLFVSSGCVRLGFSDSDHFTPVGIFLI